MKKGMKAFGAGLLEGLFEILLALVFFGIGALIVYLFGVDLDSSEMDFDLIVLIGIGAFVVIFAIVYFLAQRLKKKKADGDKKENS